jgi:hypothetical protein
LLSFVLAVLAAVVLIGSRTRFAGLSARNQRFAAIGAAVLLVISAFERAQDATEFFQFTVLGIAAGSIYAIAAAGLVLTYTTTGVFNFAHGALGMISS